MTEALQTGRLDAFFCHFQLNSTHILGQDALHIDNHLESASMCPRLALNEVASGSGIIFLAVSFLKTICNCTKVPQGS
jgi:hypothetical protein